MKKKLLPYILGCSMMAVMPFVAHADTYYHVGEDIADGTSAVVSDATTNPATDDGHNEFTEYNETNDPQNELSQTFGTPSISSGNVSWAAGTIGNTRNTTATTQGAYPVVTMNEEQDYRSGSTATSLGDDLDTVGTASPFNTNDNDSLGGENGTDTATTDLETSIPEFNMTIPAKTVLPIGATAWKLGQVEMNGKYFVNPDRIGLIITKKDFVRQVSGADVSSPTTADKITYDIQSAASSGTSYVTVLDGNGNIPARDDTTNNLAILDFHQNGTKSNAFPWTYSSYSTTDYDAGKVVEINEAKDLWLISSDWTNKNKGQFKGSITFTAYIANGSFIENGDLKTAPYPKKVDASEFWADAT